jgi:hypothetical protein
MVTKHLSITIAVAISFGIGLGLARPDFKTFAAAPISATRIDFDRVFADVTRQGTGISTARTSVIACRSSNRSRRNLHRSPIASR